MPERPIIFDRRLLRARLVRAAALGPSAFLIDHVAADLADRLAAVRRRFDLAVDVDAPTNAVRRVLAESGKVGKVLSVAADPEMLPFRDGSLDLVVSALGMQFVNDLPGVLIQIRRALRP